MADDIDRVIRDMVTLTRADLPKVTRNFARDVTKKLVKTTPLAKRRADVYVPAVNRSTGDVITRGGEPVMVAKKKNGKIVKKKVQGRGFAKASWLASLQKLGVKVRSKSSMIGPASEYSDVRTQLGTDQAGVEVESSVPYIVDLDQGSETNEPHHILRNAEQQAASQWADRIDRMAQRQVKRWVGNTVKKIGKL